MRSGRLFQFRKRSLFWLAAAFFSGTVACSELAVTNAWVSVAPPGVRVNAVYMSLDNTTSQPIRIMAISADCCAMASFHQTVMKGEMATMVHLAELDIPPVSRVILAPGDLHIMLMKPKHALESGEQVQLTLTLDNGVIQQLSVPVKSSNE